MIWLIFVLMTFAAVAYVLRPLVRETSAVEGQAADIDVYAKQLVEVDREHELGLISAGDLSSAKAEIGRRLLAAEQQAVEQNGSSRFAKAITIGVICAVVPLAAIALYTRLGQPQMTDVPLALRTQQAEQRATADQDINEVIERAERILEQNENDARGWSLIAPVYMRLGRFDDAIDAWRKVIEIDGPDYTALSSIGEALVVKASGQVTDEANEAFKDAVAIEPNGVQARFYLAMGLTQVGEIREAAEAWAALLQLDAARQNPGEQWVAAAREQLARLNAELGEDAVVAPSGPSLGASPGSSHSMEPRVGSTEIQAMVDGLAARLDADGGTVEEWTRLVRSYVVLGNQQAATAALMDGRAQFKQSGDQQMANALLEAARKLGVEPDALD